ncbi:hypothetical protein FB545_1255 [Peribacillus frigoritolerans]|uniref:hypothetical protein n=1 Tax=Peribacillus frigoritolerans TaxID=450367 RepID=UPI00119A8C87|nr:hypothetical protein [Peribacillus frigoritolerans]TWE04164.1 hypothetical protein FB545_1255 [Peribacillus frigoritolerans]
MGTEILMEKEEDSLNSRKKSVVVKLNSEKFDDFIQRLLDSGKFLVYLSHS